MVIQVLRIVHQATITTNQQPPTVLLTIATQRRVTQGQAVIRRTVHMIHMMMVMMTYIWMVITIMTDMTGIVIMQMV